MRSITIATILIVSILVSFWSCDSTKKPKFHIAAAASTKYVLDSLIQVFQDKHESKIDITYASSGLLTSQILEGAPYDIFISADDLYTRTLQERGVGQPAQVMVNGQLIFWSNLSFPEASTLPEILTQQKRIALPNPKVAPYGRAAKEYLERLDQNFEDKLIYGESVGQTSHFILSQSATGGFTAMSIIMDPKWQNNGQWMSVPSEMYTSLPLTFCLLKTTHPLGQTFSNFLKSEEAQRIFTANGYLPAGH